MESLLQVDDLQVHFAVRTGFLSMLSGKAAPAVRAVDGVSFTLGKGEILCLAGESGSGKTTTGKGVLRLVEPTGGAVVYKGENISGFRGERLRRYRREAQIIFQDPYESLNPRQTVYAAVEEPLQVNGIGGSLREREERVAKALIDAGLNEPAELFNRYPHELSGGQRQRVAIASALVLEPEFIVADEPVSMLDLSIRSGILKMMVNLRDNRGISYLFITHDLSLAWLISDRIAVMYLGKIVELGGSSDVIKSPLHPYTRALAAVIPVPRRRHGGEYPLLKGETPNPVNIPSGCRFHPRCPQVRPRCREEEPVFREVQPNRFVACHET